MTAEVPAGLRLTIDLGAIVANWRRLARLVAPATCAAVVKADAYGCGIDRVVPALADAGCRTFFVALPDEGARVRRAAPAATIYVLNGFFRDHAETYRTADLRPVLGERGNLDEWLAWRDRAKAALHVDTGMNRLGLPLDEALALDLSMFRAGDIALTMSHLACADEPDHGLNARQLGHSRRLASRAGRIGAAFSLANSAGVHLGRDHHFDLARPGIALYGGASHPQAESDPVVTAEARILQVRDAKAGESVGYGAAATLKRDSRVAILSAGYADGYPRSAGAPDGRPGAWAAIAGHRAPLVGRVSMDLMAVDVTDLPREAVRVGGWAELFGHTIGVDEVAEHAGTIAYELLTLLSRRAARAYVGAGERS